MSVVGTRAKFCNLLFNIGTKLCTGQNGADTEFAPIPSQWDFTDYYKKGS